MIRRRWICAIWRWLHPNEAELNKLSRRRDTLVNVAALHATEARLRSRELRRETGAEYQKMHAELGPINDLLARMDKRRDD